MKLKQWILALLISVSLDAIGQAQSLIEEIPPEEDCGGMIAVLPTFHSENMKVYYKANPQASSKELVAKLKSLADGDDKDAQFTYSMLLFYGYCVQKDVCAARRYLEKSRGGPNNWEKVYPITPSPKDVKFMCN